MTRARHQLICPEATPYYHTTISRCVRRAFLCGEDSLTGKSHEHRKSWVTERLRELADAFAIEICAYAIMSNHYHVVLRIDQGKAKHWDSEQVIKHWGKLYSVPVLVTRYRCGETTSNAENIKAEKIIETWRERLTDISWFMRSLNEYLARRANEEDHCKGHFWESRFKSQALLDDAAVLACMSYVDLNPVRAKMADTPEASDFTSIQQRLRDMAPKQTKPTDEVPINPIPLMRLVPQRHDPHPNSIGFTLPDYLELVDWAGREIREGKRGSINTTAPPILERLHLDPHRLMDHLHGEAMIETSVMLGSVEKLKQTVATFEHKFVKEISEARRLFRPPIVT